MYEQFNGCIGSAGLVGLKHENGVLAMTVLAPMAEMQLLLFAVNVRRDGRNHPYTQTDSHTNSRTDPPTFAAFIILSYGIDR